MSIHYQQEQMKFRLFSVESNMICQPGSILFCGASVVAAHSAVGIMAGIAADVAAARPGIRRLWRVGTID
jgi:hypothetical protein